MFKRKSMRTKTDRRSRYIAANPLWPLEELHDLRSPPLVPDPEFSPLDIRALGRDAKGTVALPTDPSRVQPSKRRRLYTFRREFPIPHLVSGLPWRFAQHLRPPVVPESEFSPFDLSHMS